MNLGIYIGAETPTAGGSHSFVRAVLGALNDVETGHSLRVLHTGSATAERQGRLLVTRLGGSRILRDGLARRLLGRHSRSWQRGLGQQADSLGLHILWFLTPAVIPTSLPYAATVWDLAHRVEPGFPEVQRTGWEWQDREAHYRRCLPRAAYVVVGGTAGRAEVERCYGVSPQRIRALPLVAPNLEHIAPAQLAGVRKPYLFYPAQFWPHKNHVGLLLAFKQLRMTLGVDTQLVLCGSDKGNLAYVRSTAADLGVENDVLFPGFVSDPELAWLYRNALALVYPSFFGPDNLPPLEAMQLGCPVIAAKVPGAEEQLGDAALLVDPRSPDNMAAAIARIHSEPALRESFIERGRAHVARWTPADYARGMLGIVDEFETERRCWSPGSEYIQPD